jgi:hypothetical protein
MASDRLHNQRLPSPLRQALVNLVEGEDSLLRQFEVCDVNAAQLRALEQLAIFAELGGYGVSGGLPAVGRDYQSIMAAHLSEYQAEGA